VSTVDHRLRALSDAAALLGRFLDVDTVLAVEALKRRAGERTGLGLDLTVVALAGGTGSGKSSLFNALAGLELAEAGVRRPTTTAALACVWGGLDADPLLDWLKVPGRRRVVRQSPLDDSAHPLDGLVLLDLPDHDSMVTEHRVEVDRLVGLVDVVVWVADPVKYADALLHEEYLARLTRHGSVVLVVLNQVDRLSAAEQRACLTDLRRLVLRDGLRGVEVLPVSAASGAGVGDLRSRLEAVVDSRQAATQRLAADVSVLAARVRGEAGLATARSHRARPHLDELSPFDLGSLVHELAHVLEVASAANDVHEQAFRQAREALRWPGEPSHPAPVIEPESPPSEPARRLLRGYLEQRVQPLPPAWAAQVRDELAGATESLPDDWAAAVGLVKVARPPAPEWWARHRARQWAVLGTAVVSVVLALALVGLLVTGSSVPFVAWAAVVVPAAAAALGAAALNRAMRGAPAAWARERGVETRDELTNRIRSDTDVLLDLPLRGQRRDVDRAQESLTVAGG
jgi:GTP-binding protein EngB required for normal cell division